MNEEKKEIDKEIENKDNNKDSSSEDTPQLLEVKREEPSEEEKEGDEVSRLKKSLEELNDKYLRLYAEFENYKKLAAKNKEELIKYANEELIKDILTVIDHLELAIQHAKENESGNAKALIDGVDLTLKELLNVLEKYGLKAIDSLGKPFDPMVHHAMSHIETEEAEENTIVKEFRKGYTLKDRVIRAALVGVAKKPASEGVTNSEAGETLSQSDNDEK